MERAIQSCYTATPSAVGVTTATAMYLCGLGDALLWGTTLLTAMAKGLEDAGAKSVATETVAGSGHYLLDEKPAETTALIERYASIASSDH